MWIEFDFEANASLDLVVQHLCKCTAKLDAPMGTRSLFRLCVPTYPCWQ